MVEAGYRTGFPQVQRERCDTCRSSAPSTQFIGKTKSDMHCNHFNAGCKTHGACPLWSATPVAVDSETAALLTSARDALLALRLANANAPSLSLWQKRANAKADTVLRAIERHLNGATK